MAVSLNLDFLTETNNGIRAKKVSFLHAHNLEGVAAHWACVVRRRVQPIGLVHVGLPNADVSRKLTLGAVVAHRYLIAAPQQAVGRKGPWDGRVGILNFAEGLVERQTLRVLTVLVVVASRWVSSG